MKSEKHERLIAEVPSTIAVIPTVDVVVFPHMVVPLLVLDDKIARGIHEASETHKKVLLVATQLDGKKTSETINEPVGLEDLYTIGTIGEIIRVMELPDGGIKVLVQGIIRAKITKIIPEETSLSADIDILPEDSSYTDSDLDKFSKKVSAIVDQLPSSQSSFSPDFSAILAQIDDPYKMSDFILSHLNLDVDHSQELLEKNSVIDLFENIITHLQKMITSVEVEEKVRANTRESINKSQREYYLREQLKAIQKELGDDAENELEEFKDRAESLELSEEARTEVLRQLRRLEKTSPDSLEATVIRNHLEWMLNMPWNQLTPDNKNINHAKSILDQQHHGLDAVKERILDFLSVKYLKEDCDTPILCLAGPPGVGKTSLGKSIAECMNRNFARIALGGVHDESEIRGHRRTYVGALPGRFIQAMRKAESMNPILLIDEIDKVGSASHKGDPAAALLEALDPEQNGTFYDNYLGVHFDLSRAMFIATANDLSTIPGPLRDRMEIIQLSGYTVQEKMEIAKHHLIPKIVKRSGLEGRKFRLSTDVVKEVIQGYTHEAGVRTLSKYVQKLCAKFARSIVETGKGVTFSKKNLPNYLGPRQTSEEAIAKTNKIGVTNGLAWTPLGGEILQVEAVLMPGTGKLILTGQLGDVMKESAQAAVTYARAHAAKFGIAAEKFTKYDLHIHLPAGAIPKDGPSAGITLASSILSAFTNRAINCKYAMTGELNLQGSVMPIGGVKEKLLAAKQRGMSHVIFPKNNKKDLDAVGDLTDDIEIVFVDDVSDVIQHVLLPNK